MPLIPKGWDGWGTRAGGVDIHTRLIRFVVQQKPTQHCEAIIHHQQNLKKV